MLRLFMEASKNTSEKILSIPRCNHTRRFLLHFFGLPFVFFFKSEPRAAIAPQNIQTTNNLVYLIFAPKNASKKKNNTHKNVMLFLAPKRCKFLGHPRELLFCLGKLDGMQAFMGGKLKIKGILARRGVRGVFFFFFGGGRLLIKKNAAYYFFFFFWGGGGRAGDLNLLG